MGKQFVWAALFVGSVFSAGAVQAQVPDSDQRCIAAFNQGVRDVARAQGKIVQKCLADYAAGRLISGSPDDCVTSDPHGYLQHAMDKATAKTSLLCHGSTPDFGTTPTDTAYARAGVGQIELTHSTLARNFSTDLLTSPQGAACQAAVTSVLLKCADRRRQEYLKCLKAALRNGSATNGPSLAAACLGTSSGGQPDPTGRIEADCDIRIGSTVLQRCSAVNLGLALSPCNANDVNGAASCLRRESACNLCQLVKDVGALPQDCDLFDDGNPTNGTCGSECPDSIIQSTESCDDGNATDGDGCSSQCTIEGGWNCSGEPSVCTPQCGDGVLDAGETCDDGNTTAGDGCSSTCIVEDKYECSGAPSVCTKKCGNGTINADDGELCDDGNQTSGDGCSNNCELEDGYNCTGEPSVCTFVCGNGTFDSGETCDDHNAASGDGCSHTCKVEPGWLCTGQPSVCAPQCGDGLQRGAEACDDNNQLSGDGCSFLCQVEAGFTCGGTPSNCIAVCGDGFIRGLENCDDGNNVSGDGCSATFCRQEPGSTCLGQPSVCRQDCGDGNLDAEEQCDDGNRTNGDGCHSNCTIETGYACGGEPSACVTTCGNGAINAGEQCDDGNTIGRDGCSAGCRLESGWYCATPGEPCDQFEVVIDSPPNGTFTTSSTALITGHYNVLPAGQVSVTVNGVPADSVNTTLRTFAHTVSLNSAKVFNPVKVSLSNTANGDDVHDRVVVINGASVADGAFSPRSVALRINDSGLDSVEPLVAGLASGALDFSSMLPSNTALIDQCFISVLGSCWGGAKAGIGNPPPSLSGIQLFMDSKPASINGDIRINNLRVDVDIKGSGLVPNCGLRLTAKQMRLTGDYSLEPMGNPHNDIDVNLVSDLGLSFTGFDFNFTYGICAAPIITDIIKGILKPMLTQQVQDGIKGFLTDPDGAGPQDSAIAGAIQSTVAGISIAEPVSAGLGLQFKAPLFKVAEDSNGITLGADSRFGVSVGSAAGQCTPPPGAPDFTASYSKPETFPSFGPNAPLSNKPYGLGIAISSDGFNQLMRGQVECGLMSTSLSEIDLDGPGGAPSMSFSAGMLSLLVPEFAQLPPTTPLRIDVAPTIAPIVSGSAGPNGELTDLRLAQVLVSFVEPGSEKVWLRGALDARLGLNLAFLPDGSGLAIGLTQPKLTDLSLTIIENPLGASEVQLESALPGLVQPMIPQLAGALSGFPLPQFFGLGLRGVEVSRNGQFMSLFANLVAGQ